MLKTSKTTKSVKSKGCSILKLLIEQNQLILQDYNTIQELSRFSKRGNSYEAESGHNDDLVMTLVLFAWLSDQRFFRELTDINTLAQLKEKTEERYIYFRKVSRSLIPIFKNNICPGCAHILFVFFEHFGIIK